MEAAKNAVAVLAGFVGLLTALLTLYAKYLDVKKSAARKSAARESADFDTTSTEPIRLKPALALDSMDAGDELIVSYAPPIRTSAASAVRSREAVRAPAITLLVAGLVSMGFNLLTAGFGYVDQFVTPLTTESQNKRAFIEAVQRNEVPPLAPGMSGLGNGTSEDANVVLTVCTLLCLSVASAAAAWAGYGMLKLRSYWLSVAGSFAIMAGGSFCCMAGIPIGIWALTVLYKPEVVASFR